MRIDGTSPRPALTLSRRHFVRSLSFSAAAAPFASIPNSAQEVADAAAPIPHRRLGRTGIRVSEIGLGGHCDGPNWKAKNSKSQAQRDAVFEECLRRGVNFCDTNSEEERRSLGYSLARQPAVRDRVLVVADVNDKDGSPQDTYRSMMTSVTEQLHNLQLPCVDVLRFTTVVRNTAPAKCEAAIRAFKQIKKQGKARYLAFSQHDPNIMLEWIERYEEIDIVYMPYNYFASKADQELFPLARKKDLGIVVIKPFNKGTIFDPRLAQLIKGSGSLSVLGRAEKEGEGRNPEDLTRGTGLTLAQASLRFILSRPEVSTVIPGMETVEEVRENLKVAHGAACGPAEKRLLAGYCGHCKNALPLDYRWLCDWRRA